MKFVKRGLLVIAGLFALLFVSVSIKLALRTPEERAADERAKVVRDAEYAEYKAKRESEMKAKFQAEHDRKQAKAAKTALAERGASYKAAMNVIGPIALADKDEVIKALQYDKAGLLELVTQGRAKVLNEGETVLVTDRDVSMLGGTWVEIRVTEGLAKGKFWVPQWALAGFEQTKV